jgi:hypothetical protein
MTAITVVRACSLLVEKEHVKNVKVGSTRMLLRTRNARIVPAIRSPREAGGSAKNAHLEGLQQRRSAS